MENRKIREILIQETWEVYRLLPHFYQERCRMVFLDIVNQIQNCHDAEELDEFIGINFGISLEEWIQTHLKKEN